MANPLSECSKIKTAFSVPGHGLWQFKVLPFGLTNASQALQRLMYTIFGPTDNRVFLYLDDLIIATETFQEHIDTLNYVHDQLVHAYLTINFGKCEFCMPSLKY